MKERIAGWEDGSPMKISGDVDMSGDGLGQELNPGKRGTVEEAAEAAEELKRRRVGDRMEEDLNRLVSENHVDIAEVFSMPRVTEEAKKFGLNPGLAIDIKNGWDLTLSHQRKKCMQWVRQNKPLMLILSPPCTAFSTLQNLNPWTARREREFWQGVTLLKFAMELAKEQVEQGRYFIFEHPASASSWKRKEVTAVTGMNGVRIYTADQCMYGLVAPKGKSEKLPAKKRTRFMSNAPEAEDELSQKCDNSHQHQQLISGRAKAAEVYPEKLRRAMCRAVVKIKRNRTAGVVRVLNSLQQVDSDDIEFLLSLSKRHDDKEEEMQAWDDVNNTPLDAEGVKAARKEELEYIVKMGVFELVLRKDAIAGGLKIIDARWIDTNKGDSIKPNLRSRFVGREFNDSKMDGLFAGTPPLEALRYLVHRAATIDDPNQRRSFMINDVSRAFFEADACRAVCCELPEGFPGAEKGDYVGRLRKSLYGTRDAAHNWVEEVAGFLKQLGFERGIYNPCLYYHARRGIELMVHGDDFASTGYAADLAWLRSKMEHRFKIKTSIVGMGAKEEKEARVLNRTIRCSEKGWEYEPDQRHAELIVKDLGLTKAQPVGTPGEKLKPTEESEEKLEPAKATQFRQIAARANYLAQDRPDIMFAVKEICRQMSSPSIKSWNLLKRLGRYLIANQRCVVHYVWQGAEAAVQGHTDSDWGGCQASGRSTSGGVVTIGEHWVKSWSKTQHCITLSSAEAELVAMSKAAAEVIGIISLAKDLGAKLTGHLLSDSSSALAIVARRGAGKLRHINISHLWLQELEKRREDPMRFSKVDGSDNPADALTKYLDREKVTRYLNGTGHRITEGRAMTGVQLLRVGRQQLCHI